MAAAHLLSELCAALSAGFEITVVTGADRKAAPGRTVHEGVEVIRVWSTAFERRQLALRALSHVTYMASSLHRGLDAKRPDDVLCPTDPPVIASIGLAVARRFGVPLVVISQDVFPEIAVELERLTNPLLIGCCADSLTTTFAAPTGSSRSAPRCVSAWSRRERGSIAYASSPTGRAPRLSPGRRSRAPGRGSTGTPRTSW